MKVGLVVLYFGKLPEYTDVFFYTLKRQKKFDLLLFTDQEVNIECENLIVYKTTFEETVKRIQGKFDFQIVCDRPYKLCDYKPVYGYVFQNELKPYDFWGHCDLDIVLGDLDGFITEDMFNEYDKIYQHGHMCLYRNCEENNTRFMSNVGMNYKDVFTTKRICVFDELIGMQKKFDLMGLKSYKKIDYADISPWYYRMLRVTSHLSKEEAKKFNYKRQIFYWEDGHIYRAYEKEGKVYTDEFSYLHFQKRNLSTESLKKINNIQFFYIFEDSIKVGKNDEKMIARHLSRPFRFQKEIRLTLLKHKKHFDRRVEKYLFRR